MFDYMIGSWERHRTIARLMSLRPLRFALVGGFCFSVQFVIMVGLENVFGAPWPIANAMGFLASAQLNLVLSSIFTWSDRVNDHPWLRWLSYNASILLGLLVNTFAFAATYRFIGPAAASVVGVAASMIFTYLVGNHVVFRARRRLIVSTGGRSQ